MDESRDSLDRLTTAEAASRLDISEAGVRKRVQRGQISHVRDETGRLWVYLDTSKTAGQRSRDRDTASLDGPATDAGGALLMAQMQSRIDSLERQLAQANERDRENRRIIAALTQRIPELPPPAQEEASSEPRGAHESTATEQDRTEEEPRLASGELRRAHRDLGGGGGSVSSGGGIKAAGNGGAGNE